MRAPNLPHIGKIHDGDRVRITATGATGVAKITAIAAPNERGGSYPLKLWVWYDALQPDPLGWRPFLAGGYYYADTLEVITQ